MRYFKLNFNFRYLDEKISEHGISTGSQHRESSFINLQLDEPKLNGPKLTEQKQDESNGHSEATEIVNITTENNQFTHILATIKLFFTAVFIEKKRILYNVLAFAAVLILSHYILRVN